MKKLFVLSILAMAVGCSTAPIVQERMVINPHTMVFRPTSTGDSTVSITHTCTCPFFWDATISPPSPWLIFSTTHQDGDRTDIPISIDSSLLKIDTSRATIHIASNSYGVDSIMVIAIR